MDQIINYLLLIIIFVFDPLAIALVIAANFTFEQTRKKYKSNLYGEKVPISKEKQRQYIVDTIKADEEDGLYEEWDSTLNDGLEEEDYVSEEEMQDMDESKYPTPNENPPKSTDIYKALTQQEKDLLASNSISSWRKNKIKKQLNPNSDEDLTKTY